jgi:hypothetical protein
MNPAPRVHRLWSVLVASAVLGCGDVAGPRSARDAGSDASPAARPDAADPAGGADGAPTDATAAVDGDPLPPDLGPRPPDAEPVAVDGGVPDAQVPARDARRPETDALPAPADATSPPSGDASPPVTDAAAPLPDAVRPGVDARPPPVDVGAPAPDALVPAADAVPAAPDVGVLGPGDAGDAAVDALSPPPDAAEGADVPAADARWDAAPLDPDSGPLCGGEAPNACGTCGPLPAEVCNALDDDCDGETDEGDADGDTLPDCAERVSGLNPAVPDDPAADPDHDDVSNADEVAAGTHAVPVLRLEYVPTDDPALFDVRVLIDPATPELRPILVEIFLRFAGRVVPEDCEIGEAAALADKDLFWHPFGDDQVRFTLLAANLQRIGSGELARVRFRRTGTGALRFTFIPHVEQLAPIETQEAATYGVGHPDTPLVVAGVPVLVNEVDYDQVSTDTTEFVELVNPNGFEVELDGLALEVRNGLTGALLSSTRLADAGASLAPGGRLVQGMPRVLAALPADVLRLAQGPNLPNAAGSVRVVDLRTDPPELLDVLGWEGARPEAALSEGAPVAEDPNDRPNLGFSRCPDANDADDNATDFALTAPTPGGSNVCP